MWHVDEGALHAYLDGALDEFPAAEALRVREHLEACAECGARLAEERRVREEAHEILGLAAPTVEVPTFEELRAYVRAQAPRPSLVSVRLYRLSWAASVVLALGTGWLLRGGVPPTLTPAASSLESPAAEEASGASPREQVAPDAAPTAERASQSFGDARGAAEVPVASPPAGAPARAERELGQSLDEVQARGVEVEDAVVLADVVDADAAARVAGDVAAGAPPADDQGFRARRLAAEPTAASSAASPSDALAAAGNRARQDSAVRDAEPARQASAEQRLTTAISQAPAVAPAPLGGGASTLGRITTGSDAPEELLNEADTLSLVVPGLEVLDVLRVGEGTTFVGMRALQRLPAGDTLETVHLPEGVDPASLPALRSGWSEIVRPRGSGWLVMRAPLPETSLLELLQRLEGAR